MGSSREFAPHEGYFTRSSKMMRSHFFPYFLIGILAILHIFPAGTAAQDQPLVAFPKITADLENSIAIAMLVSGVDNLAGLQAVISYDPQVLRYDKEHTPSRARSFLHLVNARTPGILRVVMAGAKGIPFDNQEIIRFFFHSVPPASSMKIRSTPVKIRTIRMLNDQLKPFAVMSRDGKIVFEQGLSPNCSTK